MTRVYCVGRFSFLFCFLALPPSLSRSIVFVFDLRNDAEHFQPNVKIGLNAVSVLVGEYGTVRKTQWEN